MESKSEIKSPDLSIVREDKLHACHASGDYAKLSCQVQASFFRSLHNLI